MVRYATRLRTGTLEIISGSKVELYKKYIPYEIPFARQFRRVHRADEFIKVSSNGKRQD